MPSWLLLAALLLQALHGFFNGLVYGVTNKSFLGAWRERLPVLSRQPSSQPKLGEARESPREVGARLDTALLQDVETQDQERRGPQG